MSGDDFVFKTQRQYESLDGILLEALAQASEGKGKIRHADEDENFEDQLICFIGRKLGVGFELGQVAKKIFEVTRLETTEAKVHELLGAIVYIAAAVLLLREKDL